jgi:hypothetical protein
MQTIPQFTTDAVYDKPYISKNREITSEANAYNIVRRWTKDLRY